MPLILLLCLPVGGCVSVDLGAREIVSDAIAAGKSLMRTIRHRRDGTEERLYTHVSPIADGQGDVEAGAGCLGYLRGLADAAAGGEAKVLAESTEIVPRESADDPDSAGRRAMRCTLTAVVPANA